MFIYLKKCNSIDTYNNNPGNLSWCIAKRGYIYTNTVRRYTNYACLIDKETKTQRIRQAQSHPVTHRVGRVHGT